MNTDSFLEQLNATPDTLAFEQTMAVIDADYQFQETRFTNGDTVNAAGSNNGSCKIFAFGKLHNLTEQQTLHCFGDYYRKDVLEHPEGDDHANIRNFIKHGWAGIQFDRDPLIKI